MAAVDRLRELWGELPLAHRAVLGAAAVVVAVVAAGFLRWVSTPSWAVLYTGMEPAEVSTVLDELESLGVAHRLDGSTVQVPRADLFDTRARLAGAGIAGSPSAPGYELLDAQGLSVSDFRQQVDLKRAIEGEWARTIASLDGVRSAQVHIVVPDDELFREATEPAKASVLVDPARPLSPGEVEAIVVLISGGVDGLDAADVTVADTAGNVLNLPDATSGAFGEANRNLAATRAFEAALAGKALGQLEALVGPGRASVTVNAVLDFDEATTETEAYDGDSQVSLREQVSTETYRGEGTPPGGAGGAVGTIGDSIGAADGGGASEYQRDDTTREYGVNRTVTRQVRAPGQASRLTVAVTVDDGSRTGARVPDVAAVEQLVAAAVGLDPARGDAIEVLSHPFEPPAEAEVVPGALDGVVAMVPQIAGGLTLLLAALALVLMARGRRSGEEITWLPAPAAGVGVGIGQPAPVGTVRADGGPPVPALVGSAAPQAPGAPLPVPQSAAQPPLPVPERGVAQLADRDPDQVAALLRSWLAEDGQ